MKSISIHEANQMPPGDGRPAEDALGPTAPHCDIAATSQSNYFQRVPSIFSKTRHWNNFAMLCFLVDFDKNQGILF
jgi:hypothetical protein